MRFVKFRLTCAIALMVFLMVMVCAAAESPTLFQIRQDDRHGLIDREGRVIIPPEFDQPLQLSDCLIMASKGTQTAFFDATGKMVIKPQEQIRGPFAEGVAPAFIRDAGSPSHHCSGDATKHARKLLEFHFGPDERIGIDETAKLVGLLKNPAGKGQFDVLEVWGFIYKGRYRMRFIYAQIPDECILMGQEILEYANVY